MSTVTTYHLEMNDRTSFIEKVDNRGLNIVEAEIDEYKFNQFLYRYIGEPWQWTDKLKLSDSEWKAYVEQPHLKTWVAYSQGAIAGYFELFAHECGDTEIMYFGLAQSFIGKGFGGYLLSQAIKCAWHLPSTRRVCVQTCTLDHDSALSNYQARGFSLYKTETA